MNPESIVQSFRDAWGRKKNATGGRVPLGVGGSPNIFTLDPEWDDLDSDEWLHIIKLLRAGEFGAAEGGRVPLAGGKEVLKGLAWLANKIAPKSTKIGQLSKPMAPKTELKRSIAGFQEREKAAKLKADKNRPATADELEEYGEILDPTGEAYIVEEGMTVGQLDDMVKEHYAYVDDMYQQYKRGDLEKYVKPEVLQEQKAFYQKKIDNVLETAYDDIAGGSGFTGDYKYDADVLAESIAEQLGKVYDDLPVMDQRQLYESALKRIQKDLKMKMDIKKLSKPTKTLEGIKKTGTIDISDPNVADEFSRFMKESDPKGFKDLEQKIQIESFDPKGRKKNATGGRVPLWKGSMVESAPRQEKKRFLDILKAFDERQAKRNIQEGIKNAPEGVLMDPPFWNQWPKSRATIIPNMSHPNRWSDFGVPYIVFDDGTIFYPNPTGSEGKFIDRKTGKIIDGPAEGAKPVDKKTMEASSGGLAGMLGE